MQDPVLYPFKRVVNGHEYVVWGYPNALLAQNITKLYDGYFLKATVKDNVTEIFWRSSHFFKPQLKFIGKVIYDLSCDTMIYIKHGFNSELHEFHKDNSFGLCWDVISQLRAKDIVQIEEPTVKPKGKNIYTISVSKLLENKTFRQFKAEGYEKQIFIPKECFKQEWVKVRKKRKRRYR